MTASGPTGLIAFYLNFLAAEGRPISAMEVGALATTFNIAALLSAVPFGLLIDRFSPRSILVGGAILGGVATQLFGLTGVFSIFFMSRVLEGIASSASAAGILAHLANVTKDKPNDRGIIMSWFQVTLFMGIAVGSLVSGVLFARFNAGAFSFVSAGYLVAAIVLWWAASPEVSHEEAKNYVSPLDSLRETLSNKLILQLAPAWLAFNSVAGLWLAHIAFQLSSGSRLEGQFLVGLMSPEQMGIAGFVYVMVFAVGVLLWGLVLGRVPRVTVMRLSFIGMVGVVVCFFLLNSSAEWSLRSRWLMVGLYAICIMIQAGFPPAALAYLADIADETGSQGTSMGVYTLLLSAGNIIGAALGGVFGEWRALNGLLVITLVFVLVGIASIALLPKEDKPSVSAKLAG